ncbi:hypothetical protein OH76DRAFT_217435 [Lentinus brumalis]|uniref:Uncharacterized protein n=1 Tax=Lentinus brumalis TaxID=2498619 RepID=A0A371CM98_9APHY|nr:hypothetical protein OH76DRAFT_217435 [Polyporus brumalis]
MLCTIRPLSFRPRASSSTIPCGTPPSPSLSSTTTVLPDTANTHRYQIRGNDTDGRKDSPRSIFPFRRSQRRTSISHLWSQPPKSPGTSDAERIRGRNSFASSELLAPPQTRLRARTSPNIFPSVYLPCLSKGEAPSSPSSPCTSSSSRGPSPVFVTHAGRAPWGDLGEDDEDESADPVLPRSARPASLDLMGGLEQVAATVRTFDSPVTPSRSFASDSAGDMSSHRLPEVEMLPPLSPLWASDVDVSLKALDACSVEGCREQDSGDWDVRRADVSAVDPATTSPVSSSHPSTQAAVDSSPQARRRRRRPLVVSNPDQREQLDLVLNLISERERATAAAKDRDAASPIDPSRVPVEAGPKGVNTPIPCRRRRRRPILVVSNPDEKDPMMYSGMGVWHGAEAQACM